MRRLHPDKYAGKLQPEDDKLKLQEVLDAYKQVRKECSFLMTFDATAGSSPSEEQKEQLLREKGAASERIRGSGEATGSACLA